MRGLRKYPLAPKPGVSFFRIVEIRSVHFALAAYQAVDFPRDGRPEIAFAGRSNVGKSSLINTILRRKGVARVSQTPGKTQAVQFYLVNDRFYFVDLPGYGYAKVSHEMRRAWGELVHSYLSDRAPLGSVFMLVDSRRIPSDLDLQLHEWLRATDVDWRIVMTKSDKLKRSEIAASTKAIAGELEEPRERLIPFSTVTRSGVDAVWSHIDRILKVNDSAAREGRI